MYRVFVQIGFDDYVFVATREDLEDAIKLVEGLRTCWPREYVVRDSRGNEVGISRSPRLGTEDGAVSAIS